MGATWFLGKMGRQAIIDELEASGSDEPALLYAAKQRLLSPQRSGRMLGWTCAALCLPLSISPAGIMLAIPLLPLAIFALVRSGGNIRTINEAYEDCLKRVERGPAFLPGGAGAPRL